MVEASLNLSVATSSPTQSIRIEDLVQELASVRLLLPNVEGLTNPEETRIGQELSNDDLSRLMAMTNQVSTVLTHLQTIVGNLWMIQAQEVACRLIESGELDSVEVLVIAVAQLLIDEDFSGDDEPDVVVHAVSMCHYLYILNDHKPQTTLHSRGSVG